MSSVTLTATPALGGSSYEQEGLQLMELPDVRLISIAANESQQAKASQSFCNLQWPAVGQSSQNGKVYALGLQAEQIFLMTLEHTDAQMRELFTDISTAAYLTEQSDSWVAVAVSGPQRYAALERTCPLDLKESAFVDGAVARTAMEYLSVIILRDSDRFILLSPRSSAHSFWHMLMTSANNIVSR